MGHGALRLVAVFAAAALVILPGAASAGDRKGIEEARALLAAGKPGEALEKVRRLLVVAGDDAEVLELASDAAAAAASADEALFFACAARAAALRAGRPDKVAALAAKCDALDPVPPAERAPLDEAAASGLEAARLCVRKRFFVNAVQILSRLESTPLGPRAEAELEKIYAQKQAVAALLDSSVSVPRTMTDRKSRAKLAAADAKHATWDSARTVETPNYTVRTDAGYDVAQSVAVAMEPMNRFYRRVFRTKEKGGEVRRATVRVFRTKAEMEAVAKPQRNVLGFYDPSDNSVTVYDPRSEGTPLSSLWPTLFHEASHQFTEMISGQAVPSWLNEGTASYFEGAVLRADGRVDTNLVPPYRLSGCIEALRTGKPSVREVISWSERGSYPDEYYPVGWGLVYFLRNYEDERLQKVYEKPYSALLDSYRGSGGLPSLERFVKYFVTDLKQPGVADFDAFESRLRKWIEELDYFHGGPPSAARDFAERAQKHAALGHKDDAEEDFRYALAKNPEFFQALTGLGELLAGSGRKDEAISCFRRAAEAVRRDPAASGFSQMDSADPVAGAKAALARIVTLDREVGQAFDAMDAGLCAKSLAHAEKYCGLGLHRNALRVLDAAAMLLSGAAEIEDRRRVVAQESGIDVLLPRTLDLRPGGDRVWASEGWKADGTKVSAQRSRASLLVFDAGLGDRYRFEATIRPTGYGSEMPFVGLLAGTDAEGGWECVGLSGDAVEIWKVDSTWNRLASPCGLTAAEAKSFRIAIEARPRLLRLYVNGVVVADQEFAAGELRGGIGLIAINASAEFEDLRLAY